MQYQCYCSTKYVEPLDQADIQDIVLYSTFASLNVGLSSRG
jgi:hypothetical protein